MHAPHGRGIGVGPTVARAVYCHRRRGVYWARAAVHGGCVDSQDSPLSPGIDDDAATHASLQLELRVPERQMVAAFRDAFLRWLNDRAGPFAHQGGHPEGLSLDEVPDTDGPGVRSLL